MPTYGKRGGEGATKGRTLTTYEAQTPDGTALRKGTFYIATETAYMVVIEQPAFERWVPLAIIEGPQDPRFLPPTKILPATKVSK